MDHDDFATETLISQHIKSSKRILIDNGKEDINVQP